MEPIFRIELKSEDYETTVMSIILYRLFLQMLDELVPHDRICPLSGMLLHHHQHQHSVKRIIIHSISLTVHGDHIILYPSVIKHIGIGWIASSSYLNGNISVITHCLSPQFLNRRYFTLYPNSCQTFFENPINITKRRLFHMHIDINKKDLKELYNHIKGSAKRRNIDFSLTMTDLYNLSFPLTCPILGIPLYFNRGSECDNSYSIDRIDSSKGYSIDNIIVVSNRVNKLKSNATKDEINKMAIFYTQFIQNILGES